MTKLMEDELVKFLSKNFNSMIETYGTICCHLKYCHSNTKLDIAVVFTRYFHDNDPIEYEIGDAGYVLTLPSFWVQVPKPLVIPYISSYIDNYLNGYISKHPDDGSGSWTPDTEECINPAHKGGPCCPPITPPPGTLPPMPVPPIKPGIEQAEDGCDSTNHLAGYFVSKDE